jgi:hypothetical protein
MLPDPMTAHLRGPTIDVFFKFSGERYRIHRQRPLGGPPSTSSSTSVVEAARPTGSIAQGAHHRCRLQHQWRTLPDLPVAPPGALPSMSSSSSVVDAARPTGNAPRGPTINGYFNRHRHRAISDSRCQYLLPTPPRGPLVNYHYWACYKQGISQGNFFGSLR